MPSHRRPHPWMGLLYPPLAARHVGNELHQAGERWWLLLCVALFIPVAAAFHHLIFSPHQCLLAEIGYDYDPVTVVAWLKRDPSPAWAAVAVLALHWAGLRSRWARWIRLIAAPVFVSFVPLSVYLWDIPFTNKVICRLYHDGKLVLFGSTALRTAHLYVLGFVSWGALLGLLVLERRRLDLRSVRQASRSAARARGRFPVLVQEPRRIRAPHEASPPASAG